MNKIAIFSTSSRAVEVIKNINNNFEIPLIVTKSDKVVGRKKEVISNEVKKFAIQNKINFIEIDKFDINKKQEVREALTELGVDLAISIDFGFILPEMLINIPKHKFINVHFSLLPRYRGASAVQFAILNDDKEFGISYHLIDKTLDTGDIIFQSHYPLDENLNSEEAYQFLFNKCKDEISGIINKYINQDLKPIPQDHSKATYTYSTTNPKYTFIFKEDAKITDEDSERKIFRKIKAYNPWPFLEILAKDFMRFKQFENYNLKPGFGDTVVKINEAKFKDGSLYIEEVTVQNGKRLKINDFINGFLKKK